MLGVRSAQRADTQSVPSSLPRAPGSKPRRSGPGSTNQQSNHMPQRINATKDELIQTAGELGYTADEGTFEDWTKAELLDLIAQDQAEPEFEDETEQVLVAPNGIYQAHNPTNGKVCRHRQSFDEANEDAITRGPEWQVRAR